MMTAPLREPAAPGPLAAAAVELPPHGFAYPGAALGHLRHLAEGAHARELQPLLPELLARLAESADPDHGLVRFERFLRAHAEPRQLLAALRERPSGLGLLAAACGGSPFLAETLVRHPDWFHWLEADGAIGHLRSPVDIESALARALSQLGPHPTHEAEQDALRLAKRRELLHIALRDLLRLATVEETLGALSGLAEVLIQQACALAEAWQRRRDGLAPAAGVGRGFTVLGLGKLGGSELNFSSDVDLVYLYATDRGRVSRRRHAASRTEFAHQMARRVTAALADTTGEGIVYRVDLRLRPEGRSGPVAGSLASLAHYYRARGATWERLALLKARPVAGDAELGMRLLQRVKPFVFGRGLSPDDVRDVLRMKRAVDRRVAERHESQRDVKLGVGGIREIELVAQALQVRHGRARGALRVRGTLPALAALRESGLLPAPEADALRHAYLFLRDLENKLQMLADAQVHSLPRGHEELKACARRLGYRDAPGVAAEAALLRAHAGHTEAVHRIFEETFSRIIREAGEHPSE